MQNDYFIPLVLGVTGHRDINPGDARLVAAIQSQLDRLKAAYPHSPFLILSSLAEGADRLVARLAMKSLGARLIVPLPFSETEYRKDFGTAESQEEFTEMLGRAESVFLVAQKEEATALAEPGQARNSQYARAGAWVAENAPILLAVWDGQPARGVGGTADVVKWRQDGTAPKAYSTVAEHKSVLAGNDPGFVIAIHPATGECRDIPVNTTASLSTTPFGEIDRFNRDADCLLRQPDETELARSEHFLLGDQRGDPLIAGNESIQELVHRFAMADCLAGRFQSSQGGLIGVVTVLFFLAMAFSNQSGLKWAVAAYGVLMGLIFVVALGVKHWRVEDRYFDYRALAEGLRVAIFWRLCGIRHRVSLNYLSQHVGIVAWVREALRSVELTLAIPGPQAAPAEKAKAFALADTLWLQDQARFFNGRTKRFKQRHKWLRWVSFTGFVLSVVVAICKTIAQHVHTLTPNQPDHFIPVLFALFGLLVAVGLAAGYYDGKKTHTTLIKRYTLSASLYQRASEKLSSPDYPPDAVILEIGREALSENADWLWTQRDVPLKPGGSGH